MRIKRIFLRSIVATFIMSTIATSAHADWRSYVWAYEYMTMPKEKAELEYYVTTNVPDLDDSSTNTWKHYMELEYGLTERFDVAMYQTFKQTNTSSTSDFDYDGFKLRARYRFGQKGKYLLDPLLYLEYEREADLGKPHVLEGKIILAKDIGKVNLAYNQILKQELESDGETEHEYAFGVNYAISPTFKSGLESKGNYTKEKYYLGPTLSLATERFWISLGTVFGLNTRSDDMQTRMIVGIPF